MNIALMIGSIRKERKTDRPAKALVTLLEERGIEAVVLDLQELDLPMFDDGIEHVGRTKLLETYKEMDGIIIVAPEYNKGIPAPVKNAIDYAREKELVGKPMTICTTSGGPWGGTRMTTHLQSAWLGDGGIALPIYMQTPALSDFDAENPPEQWLESANSFLDKSMHWFSIIKAGKEVVK